ncbi:MAG: hypothetical protein JXQ72_17120 [Anaerolineae bacterium]|nr:hypothetical protein [Anaerolineae bacterium]
MTQIQEAPPLQEESYAALNPSSPIDSDVLPSQMNFAQEVRAERLAILWKVTLFVSFVTWWVFFVVKGGRDMSVMEYLLPSVMVGAGCILAGRLLATERFMPAVWSYSLGAILAVGIAMAYDTTFTREYMPFVFPLLVFVVGLLLPVRDTFLTMLVVLVTALFIPIVADRAFDPSNGTIFALALTIVAAALSAQVSGELYAIAEWALENYRKERHTTQALFDNREALQKSFMRQMALTEQVQQANKELEVARKAEEEAKHFRGQFLANMSHELRTPLNAIIGFSQTMLDFPAMYDGVVIPPQYRQDMSQILNSGQHLLSIINDILDLSKVDAGKLELEIQPVDLGPIIKGVLSTAVGLVGAKKEQIQLIQEAPDPLPMVMGDPLRVRQILLNFFSNAAKFTDVGHIKLKVYVDGPEVVFAVEDTGLGIDDQDRATIFEEFRQGTIGRKKGRQGAGLGLAISQQLIRLMNGRLWFNSILGKGSTFCIALPLHVPVQAETNGPKPDAADAVELAPEALDRADSEITAAPAAEKPEATVG